MVFQGVVDHDKLRLGLDTSPLGTALKLGISEVEVEVAVLDGVCGHARGCSSCFIGFSWPKVLVADDICLGLVFAEVEVAIFGVNNTNLFFDVFISFNFTKQLLNMMLKPNI